jgi:hypothetical protein
MWPIHLAFGLGGSLMSEPCAEPQRYILTVTKANSL